MNIQEIKTRLETRGYYISPNYGLILENQNDEYTLADIRKCEEKIILPYYNKTETESINNLRKILFKEEIPFRDRSRSC